ncbi:MAG: hypothetical protein RSF02_03170 [Bacilli bacterium]
MRTFYVFKINKELSVLLDESPYNIYKTLEGIYLLDKTSVSYGKDMLEQVTSLIDKEKINKQIFEKNKDNDFYTLVGNNHRILNKYRQEETNIFVRRTHILITTNVLPRNINSFLPANDLFVCDFENKDYFWLSKLVLL